MKFFGVIFAVLAVASAKHLGNQVQTRTIDSTYQFIMNLQGTGCAQLYEVMNALTPLSTSEDPVAQAVYQPVWDSIVNVCPVGYDVKETLMEIGYDDPSDQINYVKSLAHSVYDYVKQDVDLAVARGVAGASDLQARLDALPSLVAAWDAKLDAFAADIASGAVQLQSPLFGSVDFALADVIVSTLQTEVALMADTVSAIINSFSA